LRIHGILYASPLPPVILAFGAFEQMELDESRHLVEMAVARQPDVLEGGLGPLGDAEPVHGDKYRAISQACWTDP
jgi:hypothetical protein